jgi:hypothetical protein
MAIRRLGIVAGVCLVAMVMPVGGQTSMAPVEGSASLIGARGVAVPVVRRSETRSLIDLGTVDTEGYERIVVNLAGSITGADEVGGTVGVILIPDVPPFNDAFNNLGLLPASLEITVQVDSRRSQYFMATQQKFDVGFPRYRALAYNMSRSPVSISFFVYRLQC